MEKIFEELDRDFVYNTPVLDYEDPEYEFLSSFLEQFNLNDVRSVLKINKKDFVLAYLCATSENEDFEVLQGKVNKLSGLSTINDYHQIHTIAKLITAFMKHDALEELAKIPLLSEDTLDETVASHPEEYKKFYKESLIDSLSMLHILLSKNLCKTEEERKIFFSLLFDYPQEFFSALMGVMTLLSVNNDLVDGSLKEVDPKRLEQFMNSKIIKCGLDSHLRRIEERYRNIIKEKKERCKKENRRQNKYAEVKAELQRLSQKRNIKLSEKFLSMIDNENIKFRLLNYALKNNRESYAEVEESLAAEASTSQLESLFKNSWFDFTNLSEEEKKRLSKSNIEQIAKMFELINDKHFCFLKDANFPIVSLLLLSTPEKIRTIRRMITQGIITEEFVAGNPSVFADEIDDELNGIVQIKEGYYTRLMNNIATLKERKIETQKVAKCNPSLLIQDPENVKKNVSSSCEYCLDYSKASCFDLLEDDSLIRYIDIFIELGLYDYIKKNPNIINKGSINLINRIILCTKLGIPVVEASSLNPILLGDSLRIGKAVISDNTISSCIENSTDLYMNEQLKSLLDESKGNDFSVSEIDELVPFKKSEFEYDINGVIVSRKKALRNYSVIMNQNGVERRDILLTSLVYGSIFDKDSLDKVYNAIDEKGKKKEKKH